MRAMLAAFLLCASCVGAASLTVVTFQSARAQGASASPHGEGDVAEGQQVWKRANCIGCHKWHGGGGGGYGGDALSLRATQLDRDQIVETVTCGRPGTGMPYFARGVYDNDAHPCFGSSRQDLGKDMPIEAPATFLRPSEIKAVADYVVADLKGKGEPTYPECIAFFGDGSRVCNVYKTEKPSEPSNAASGQSDKKGS